MRLAHRLRQLGRMHGLKRAPSPMEQFQRAFDEASIRLTGKCGDQIAGDDAAVDLVMYDLGQSFIRTLTDADLATLAAEFERLAFRNDTQALEAAEREMLASLDAEAQCAADAAGRT